MATTRAISLGEQPPSRANWRKPIGPDAVAGLRDRLMRLAWRFLWNRHDAEEVAQEAVAAGLASLHRLRDADRLDAYLSRVAVNLALMRRRRRPGVALGDTFAARDAGPQAHAAGTELREIVRRFAARLPRRQEIAFVLKDMEDWPYEQVAGAMQITQGAARAHVHAARLALREMIRREAPGWLPEAERG